MQAAMLYLRLFVEECTPSELAAFEHALSSQIESFANIVRCSSAPYWKIPNWTEVFIITAPFESIQPREAFSRMLNLVGTGWTMGGDESEPWAVADIKIDAQFLCTHVRWAHIELSVS